MTFSFGTHPAAGILKIVIKPEDGVAAAAKLLDAGLRRARVLHLTGGGVDHHFLQFWADVNERIGRIDTRGENPLTLERLPAIWNDIRFDPALATVFRHSNSAQPLHTDGAYNDTPPNIGFFFCQRQARRGGRTVFLDADYLCDVLRRERPVMFAELQTVPVAYMKGDSPGQVVPIIRWDAHGPLINWNYYRFVPGQSTKVQKLREDFFTFLDERFIQTGDVAPLHLEAGDCMAFHDLRCLHGREAYTAESAGERCLWNLNLHWDGQAIVGRPSFHEQATPSLRNA
jgi:alpha-ketoglutarate-dependent taurine dioxygenase